MGFTVENEELAKLNEENISVAHYDMIFLRPLDEDIMNEVAEKNVGIITVEDGIKDGGLGSAVTEWLNDHSFNRRVIRLGMCTDSFVPHGTPSELYKLCGLDPDSIANAAKFLI